MLRRRLPRLLRRRLLVLRRRLPRLRMLRRRLPRLPTLRRSRPGSLGSVEGCPGSSGGGSMLRRRSPRLLRRRLLVLRRRLPRLLRRRLLMLRRRLPRLPRHILRLQPRLLRPPRRALLTLRRRPHPRAEHPLQHDSSLALRVAFAGPSSNRFDHDSPGDTSQIRTCRLFHLVRLPPMCPASHDSLSIARTSTRGIRAPDGSPGAFSTLMAAAVTCPCPGELRQTPGIKFISFLDARRQDPPHRIISTHGWLSRLDTVLAAPASYSISSCSTDFPTAPASGIIVAAKPTFSCLDK